MCLELFFDCYNNTFGFFKVGVHFGCIVLYILN